MARVAAHTNPFRSALSGVALRFDRKAGRAMSVGQPFGRLRLFSPRIGSRRARNFRGLAAIVATSSPPPIEWPSKGRGGD
jgi:hypothetical protein